MSARSPAVHSSPEAPPRERPATSPAPRVWALTTERGGDRAQILALAEALGWPFEEKRLRHNPARALPNLVLGATRLSLDSRASDLLTPPLPALVIASGRRSVPAARWIRRQSGGTARLVHIGRPWAPLSWFDLVVTTAQYGLTARPNVLANTLTLNRLDRARLDAAARHWTPRWADLPAPRIAVIVGGDARPYRFDTEAARALGQAANDLAAARGGSLLITTSKRTPPAAVDALFGAISRPAYRHRWSENGENPYAGLLAVSDELVVTGDSASMLSEACATGKPVYIYDLPERLDARLRLARGLRRLASGGEDGPAGRLYRKLVDLGLLTSTRDMALFHDRLVCQGLAARLGDTLPARAGEPPSDLDRAANRVRALFTQA